jgi:hypothetical protein
LVSPTLEKRFVVSRLIHFRSSTKLKKQGDDGSDGEPANLGIADGFPERAAFERDRKQERDQQYDSQIEETICLLRLFSVPSV